MTLWTVDTRELDALCRAFSAETRSRLHLAGARSVAVLCRRHLRALGQSRHASANRLGAAPSGHFEQAIVEADASADDAHVRLLLPGLSRAFRSLARLALLEKIGSPSPSSAPYSAPFRHIPRATKPLSQKPGESPDENSSTYANSPRSLPRNAPQPSSGCLRTEIGSNAVRRRGKVGCGGIGERGCFFWGVLCGVDVGGVSRSLSPSERASLLTQWRQRKDHRLRKKGWSN